MKQKSESRKTTPTPGAGGAGPEVATVRARFALGRIVITPNADRELVRDDAIAALARHGAGDWGGCGTFDWHENDCAVKAGRQLRSVYCDRSGTAFWIITEADRSVTTVLLPSDY